MHSLVFTNGAPERFEPFFGRRNGFQRRGKVSRRGVVSGGRNEKIMRANGRRGKHGGRGAENANAQQNAERGGK